jgi:hypothetical protein
MTLEEDARPSSPRSVRVIYTVAGVYGLLVLTPGLFMEGLFNRTNPPSITHPEFYCGFYGSAIVWQLVFLAIGRNPAAFRRFLPLTVLEKAAFFVPALWLYLNGRLAVSGPLFGALIDGLWMLAFLLAIAMMRRAPH